MTPVHQLIFFEAKTCMFVINKSIINLFLTLNYWFRLKYEFSVHNIAFSSEKSSCLNQERNMHKWSTVYKKNSPKHSYFLPQKLQFKAEMPWWICFLQTCSFSFDTTLTDGICGLIVDYCDVFISCLTLILMAPIYCRGSNDEQVM